MNVLVNRVFGGLTKEWGRAFLNKGYSGMSQTFRVERGERRVERLKIENVIDYKLKIKD